MDNINKGIIVIEVLVPSPEKYLNLLWRKDIRIGDIKRKNIKKLILTIDYMDYEEVKEITENFGGKIKILNRKGKVFLFRRLMNKKSLIIAVFLFLGVLYYLSTYVWAIEIKTEENLPPYEIRQDLKELGIKPGMRKNDIDVYKLETQLEEKNKNILWLRIRIEGSALKVIVEEKINPPKIEQAENGDCIAKMSGEIKRIYVTSGTAQVAPGDFVKEGDILIVGSQGKEGEEYEVPAKGVVIANTFYERIMEVQVSGNEFKRSNKKDKDIYLNFWGVKIYLKKAINNFENYDKIEENNNFINTVTYYEKKEEPVNVDREEVINKAADELEKSLVKSLNNEAVISNKNISVEDVGDGKIRVKVMFIIEQNIAYDITKQG